MTLIIFNENKHNLFTFLDLNDSLSQQKLEDYHNEGARGQCQCRKDDHTREISIKKREHFYLTRMPGTSKEHAAYCPFGISNKDFFKQDISENSITEKSNGMSSITLGCYLEKLGTSSSPKIQELKKISRQSTKSRMTLLGLLLYLLEKGNLITWYPNRKFPPSFNSLSKAISEVANFIEVGKKSMPLLLSDILYIPSWNYNNKNQTEINRSELFKKSSSKNKAVLIIGEVTSWSPSKNTSNLYELKIKYLDNKFLIKKGLAEKAISRFTDEISGIPKINQNVLMICSVFRNEEILQISNISFKRFTKEYIPVDSSYEITMATKLVEQKRMFKKPVRLNKNDLYLPDFVLLDTQQKYIIEVFGMMSVIKYQAHAQEKKEYYIANHIPFISWIPGEEMPDFPVAKLLP